MGKKPVTLNQAKAVMNMANEKGVGRGLFQEALDDGSIARFLDDLKQGLGGLVPPPGARLHVVRARVKHGREWQEAVDAAGPNTPSHYNVRKVADLYPPVNTEETEKNYVLLNFPNGDGYDKALAWAQSVGLKPTVPREVFAIGEHNPDLHQTLACNPMYVVATTECTFGGYRRACYVWWIGSKRGAHLDWVSDFGSSNDWFSFCK